MSLVRPPDDTLAAPRPRVPFLDALRGLAALSVVIVHIVMMPSPYLQTPFDPRTLLFVGSTGVCIFFAVSTYSLFYTMPQRLAEARPLTSFYLRRFFRIAPLFYFWLAVRLLHDYWVGAPPYSLREVVANLTFTFNVIPAYVESLVLAGWTVGVEELFYASFPLIFWLVRGVKSAFAFCVATALVAFGAATLFATLDGLEPWALNLQRWSFAVHAQTFAMGALAFYVAPRITQRVSSRWRPIVGVAIVLAATALLIAFAGRYGVLPRYVHWQGIICLLFIVGLQVQTLRIVDNRLTQYLGRISFSFYLAHPLAIAYLTPVYRQIYGAIGYPALSLLCCVLLTCAILIPAAELTYRLIEERGIDAGRAVYRRISDPPMSQSWAWRLRPRASSARRAN